MKPVLKGIFTAGVVLVASVLGRQASVGLTNDLAMLQMQNVDYIPNLSGTYGLINTATWLVAGLIVGLIWKKEISALFKS